MKCNFMNFIRFFIYYLSFFFCSVVLSSPSTSSYQHLLVSGTNFTVRYNVYFPASSGWSIEKITVGLDLISANRFLSNSISAACPALGVTLMKIPVGAYNSVDDLFLFIYLFVYLFFYFFIYLFVSFFIYLFI